MIRTMAPLSKTGYFLSNHFEKTIGKKTNGLRYPSRSTLAKTGGQGKATPLINLDDYQPEDAKLVIWGKGSKSRNAYLEDGAIAALKSWDDSQKYSVVG